MASSSSSAAASQLQKKYDVFISFRGEDTRSNFTSHLHDALHRNQIDTYIDYRLEKGDEVWPALEKAIEDSTLFLVIFSENYASSTWCLKELTKILECTDDEGKEQLVIPVFYKVDPSSVRKQLGSYQKAFKEYEQDNNKKQQVYRWREALTHASNLAGWDSSVYWNEVELIEEIVKCVVRKLDSMYHIEGNLKNLVGIHEKIAGVESLLYKGSPQDVRFIGLWGMGGIGKTTLARAVYDKLRSQYEGCCFLNNVREESKKYGITDLAKRLISTLLGDKESHGMRNEITPYDMRRLSRKRNLIVLDDVDDQEHLENLVGRHDWFGTGSKILITTRDKHVLSKEVDDVYEVKPLKFEEAFRLFSMNALKNDSADQKLRGLAKNVISYASGIPLALKVLGSFLYSKSHKEWESQLEKLKKISPSKILDVLKLSFEGLDHEEKNIFLDIACIFKDRPVDFVKNLLDACGYSTIIGLKSLEDKALLNIDGRKRITMHDLIQEMGFEIVREESREDPKRRSRLWNSSEIFQILKDGMGTEAIEAMTLNVSEIEEISLSPQTFCSMPNLKFLDFHINFIEKGKASKLHFRDGLEFLPKKLRLLHWESYPLKYLPATFKAENLVTIQMRKSKLTKLWDGCQNLVNLHKIDLIGSKNLIELPNFSKAIRLNHIDLSFCSKLRRVHTSILSLHSLKTLNLKCCRALTSLTSHTHLKSLSLLDLTGCLSLIKFSVTSKCAQFRLLLSSIAAINVDELSSSSGHLSKIDGLYIEAVGQCVTNLPYKWADLRNLRTLCIGYYDKLALKLHFILDELRALESLSLEYCSDLCKLPDNMCFLSSLRFLDLQGTNVETLPVSIKHLQSLSVLDVRECERLRYLPELPPSIIQLLAGGCTFLETLHITSTTAVTTWGPEQTYSCFDFKDCMKLDQQLIQIVEAKVLLLMNNGIDRNSVEFIYPGNKVPEWFVYRSTQSSITMDLFSIPKPFDWSFIFCMVVSKPPSNTYISMEWFIDGQCFTSGEWFYSVGLASSDTVCLWYDKKISSHIQSIIETYDESRPLLEIKFTVGRYDDDDKDDDDDEDLEEETVGKIIGCGVCPTYAPQYQNYIKQIEWALQPQPHSIGMEAAGCSSHNTHDKEPVSRKRKYNMDLEELDSGEN